MRHRWQAQQAGRIIADGAVEALTDKDAMRDVLASRAWPGRDWKLRVGGASLSFDEEDVPKLAGEITNKHAKDEALPSQVVPKGITQAVLDVLKKSPVVEETRLGVTPTAKAWRVLYEKYGSGISPDDDSVSTTYTALCCGGLRQLSIKIIDPTRVQEALCMNCGAKLNFMPDELTYKSDGKLSVSGRTGLTQVFARLGLPANAAFYALRKMNARSEDVLGVCVSVRDMIGVRLRTRVGFLGTTFYSFTRKELEAAW